MIAGLRFTTADLERLPDRLDAARYEIIDGELHLTKQPSWQHQQACGRVFSRLDAWSVGSGAGETSLAPGVLFAEDENVAPDVAWVNKDRLPALLDGAGHLRAAPDLVVEVLSPGAGNEERDRETKRRLYSRWGVLEYWLVSWQLRQVEVYRREAGDLGLAGTLRAGDILESPILPGFSCPVAQFFP